MSRPDRLRWIFLVLLLAYPCASRAGVLRVPAEHATIGEAAESAAAGDTLLVAEGVYRETLFLSKSLVLLGGWDPSFRERDPRARETVIDGEGADRSVVTAYGDGGEEVLLDGFTIRNGWVFEGNGGGVFVYGGVHAVIRDCVIRENYARYHGGGACFFAGASGRVEGNLFVGNSAVFHGGGLCLLDRARVEIVENRFVGNRVVFDSGGGVAALKQCVAAVLGNRFEGNFAMKRGGAVSFLQEVDGRIERNLGFDNRCGDQGASLYSWKSSVRIEENTLVRNHGFMGGIRVEDTGSVSVRRNLVVRSTGPWLMHEGKAALEAEGNVVWASAPAEGPEGAGPLGGVRVLDPGFCDEAGDHRLRPRSPLLGELRAGCYRATCSEEPGPGEPPLRRGEP